MQVRLACLVKVCCMLLLFCLSLVAVGQAQSAVGYATIQPRAATTPPCRGIYWIYKSGYYQLALLPQPSSELAAVQWDNTGSQDFKASWRNGQTTGYTLRLPGRDLIRVGFFCDGDGMVLVKVIDCDTKQPIHNALFSDVTRKMFKGHPSEPDGSAVLPCNCKAQGLPRTLDVVVEKNGYRTYTTKLTFAGDRLNSYTICLKKGGDAPANNDVLWRGHRYRVVTNPADWNNARQQAQSMGGYLVCISDAAENQFVRDLVKQRSNTRTYWIGFSDQGSEGRWWWVNRQPVSYTNWHKGEPNNSDKNENCCEVGWHGTYSWNDGTCTEKMVYVVEFDN